MSTSEFPSPAINDDMQPFFEATAQHRFVMMRCKHCGSWSWPYGGCRNDHNEAYLANMEWKEASGRGKVHTFTIARQAFHNAFPTPYVFAIVELNEGPIMATNIVGCAPEKVRIDMPVSVVFENAPNGVVLPKFKPA